MNVSKLKVGDILYRLKSQKSTGTGSSSTAIYWLTVTEIILEPDGSFKEAVLNGKERVGWSGLQKLKAKIPQWGIYQAYGPKMCYTCRVRKGEEHKPHCPWYKAPKGSVSKPT